MVGEANYGEENTWREGDKDRLEGKCEETLIRENVGVTHELSCVIQLLCCYFVARMSGCKAENRP